jgi:hypothetical protein
MHFSIRDLLWATSLVAMGLAWRVDHARVEDRCEEFVDTDKRCQTLESKVASLTKVLMFYPVAVEGDISMSLGDAKVIVAPPGSAAPGSEWLEVPVRYTNFSGRPLWIDGYAARHPFYGIQTRGDSKDEWVEYSMGFCGTGALLGPHRVAPGASWLFKVALPKRYEGQQCRISLPYRTDARARPNLKAQSAAIVLARPGE